VSSRASACSFALAKRFAGHSGLDQIQRQSPLVPARCAGDTTVRLMAHRPLRALRPGDKGQAGACPDRTLAIPCTLRAGTRTVAIRIARAAARAPRRDHMAEEMPLRKATARMTVSPRDLWAR